MMVQFNSLKRKWMITDEIILFRYRDIGQCITLVIRNKVTTYNRTCSKKWAISRWSDGRFGTIHLCGTDGWMQMNCKRESHKGQAVRGRRKQMEIKAK